VRQSFNDRTVIWPNFQDLVKIGASAREITQLFESGSAAGKQQRIIRRNTQRLI
jgi:hypothetical protein